MGEHVLEQFLWTLLLFPLDQWTLSSALDGSGPEAMTSLLMTVLTSPSHFDPLTSCCCPGSKLGRRQRRDRTVCPSESWHFCSSLFAWNHIVHFCNLTLFFHHFSPSAWSLCRHIHLQAGMRDAGLYLASNLPVSFLMLQGEVYHILMLTLRVCCTKKT